MWVKVTLTAKAHQLHHAFDRLFLFEKFCLGRAYNGWVGHHQSTDENFELCLTFVLWTLWKWCDHHCFDSSGYISKWNGEGEIVRYKGRFLETMTFTKIIQSTCPIFILVKPPETSFKTLSSKLYLFCASADITVNTVLHERWLFSYCDRAQPDVWFAWEMFSHLLRSGGKVNSEDLLFSATKFNSLTCVKVSIPIGFYFSSFDKGHVAWVKCTLVEHAYSLRLIAKTKKRMTLAP